MNIPLRQYWDLLARHIKPQIKRFWLLTFLLLSSIGMQVISPQITRYFIDAAEAGAPNRSLLIAALSFVALAVLQQILAVSGRYVGENVAWTATNALRSELARHCLYLDMSFHNDTSPGQLIERIDGDVAKLANFFSQLVIRVIGSLILLAGILVALYLEDWRVGLVFTVYSALGLLAFNSVRGLAVPHEKARRQANADLMGFIEERMAGTEDIRSSGAVEYVMRGLYKLHYTVLGHWRKASMRYVIVHMVGGGMITLGSVMAIVAGFYLHREGLVTIGTVYLLIHYTNLLARPIRDLTRQIEDLQTIGASTQRLSELRAIKPKTNDGSGIDFPPGPAGIEFAQVSFAYIEEEPVLRNVSFELQAGRVMGLLGRTGSGKTTLARLVFRLFDPTLGSILLQGHDIRRAKLRSLRQRVAMVTQDVQLFQATVRDNLTFFDHSISDQRIRQVIDELELSDWYASLPEGLDTRLETGGRGLSAGEGQLLAFTRVFLRDPGLVILDEASSRLDPATEQRIERAVDRLLQDRTAIIIAHRLGTVERADDIMILDGGEIAEIGLREALAADSSSRFHHLLQTGLEEVLA